MKKDFAYYRRWYVEYWMVCDIVPMDITQVQHRRRLFMGRKVGGMP